MEEAELLLMNELASQRAQQSGLIPTEGLRSDAIQVNGFVFSVAAIYRKLERKQAVAEARWCQSRNWDYSKLPPFPLLTSPKAA